MTPQLLSTATLLLAAGASVVQPDVRGLVRDTPTLARDSVVALLVRSAEEPEHLRAAAVIAGMYAAEWVDSSLLLRTSIVERMSAAQRRLFARADAMRRAGNAALYADGPVAAIDQWRESAAAFAAAGDTLGVALAHGNVGAGFYELGRLDSAAVYAERARRAAARSGDRRTLANAITMLGNIALERGDFGRALAQFAEAADLHEAIGDHEGLAADYTNLGIVRENAGDPDAARSDYERARKLYHAAGDRVRVADLDVNLGTLDLEAGGYRRALGRFAAARDLYTDAGEWANVALVRFNEGSLHARLAEYEEAVQAYESAARLYRELESPAREFEALRSLTSVRAAIGEMDEAESTLSAAERLATDPSVAASPSSMGALWLTRGDLALRLNRLSEARGYYQRAGASFFAARDAAGWASSVQGRGAVAVAAGSPDDARDVLAEPALGTLDTPETRWGRLALAAALRLTGSFSDARAVLDTLAAKLDHTGEVETWAAVQLELGALDHLQNRPRSAEARFRSVLSHAGHLPAIGWRVRRQLALLLEERHAYGEATQLLDAAAAQLASVSDRFRLDTRRSAFMSNKWVVYTQLARVLERMERPDSSFAVSEALRARQLLDLLTRGRLASAPLALVAAEQDLRRRMAELSDRVTAWAPGGSRDAELRQTADTREALWRVQDRYRAVLDTLSRVAPEYSALVRGETAGAGAVRAALGGETVFVEYLLGEQEILIYAMTRDTTVVARIAAPRFAVAAQIDFARGILSRPDDGRRLWRAPLERLHDLLIQPVAAVLEGHPHLVIAPHRELHYLPFEALVDRGGQFLVERFDVTYAPSASVWLHLANRPAPSTRGVLAAAPLTASLPGATREVAAIERLVPEVTRVTGPLATETWLTQHAATFRVVHLATRGVLNRYNPLFSYVETQPDDGSDGRLEVHEIFGVELDAELVVLSACHTALGSGAVADVPEGDDWVGLVRALLFAGARNVLATLWAVDDQATADFMSRFYTAWVGSEDVAQDLADAKRAAIRAGGRPADPYYWAGFVTAGASRPFTGTEGVSR